MKPVMMTFWEGRPTVREAGAWVYAMMFLAEGHMQTGIAVLMCWLLWLADVEMQRRPKRHRWR